MALYAFDGTWNVRDAKSGIEAIQSAQYGPDQAPRRDTAETNVHRFWEYAGQAAGGEYLQGVGTRFGILGRALGGAFGLGGRHRIRRMYRRLQHRFFVEGDRTIDVVGFSRGAAMAVHFVNVLERHGLRHPENQRHVAWKYFPELGWTFRHPKSGTADVPKPEVRFLGLWDTVATFGVPIWPLRNRSKKWMVWEIPALVRRSFHAMAIDEVRSTFALIRPRHVDPLSHSELWFRGVHSNVGGGYLDRGLSDIALAWMMEQYVWTLNKAKAAIPAPFEEALRLIEPLPGPNPSWVGSTLETLEPDPNGVLARPADIRRQAWREVPENALFHHSVNLRNPNLISDHYSANRQLLRRMPKSARPVYDPPIFYDGTRQARLLASATEAFSRIPVRPRDWLRVETEYVFRSDHWVALGSEKGREQKPKEEWGKRRWKARATRESFLAVAAAWFDADKPDVATGLALPARLQVDARESADSQEIAAWVVQALKALDPYLRE